MIAHRLSTVRNADQILVVEDGRVVEVAAPTPTLLAAGGLYADLYRTQFRRGPAADAVAGSTPPGRPRFSGAASGRRLAACLRCLRRPLVRRGGSRSCGPSCALRCAARPRPGSRSRRSRARRRTTTAGRRRSAGRCRGRGARRGSRAGGRRRVLGVEVDEAAVHRRVDRLADPVAGDRAGRSRSGDLGAVAGAVDAHPAGDGDLAGRRRRDVVDGSAPRRRSAASRGRPAARCRRRSPAGRRRRRPDAPSRVR